MGDNNSRQFLDFEKPIKDLYDQIDQLNLTAEKNKIDLSDSVRQLEEKILDKKKEITDNLTSWQKVQLSRHPDRPYTLSYIEKESAQTLLNCMAIGISKMTKPLWVDLGKLMATLS